MPVPENFILTTDYPTFKNDQTLAPVTIVVPSAISIPGNDTLQYSTDIAVNATGGVMRASISSSLDSSRRCTTTQLESVREGDNGGPVIYSVYAFLWHPSPTIIRAQILIPNPYGTTTTGAVGAETFTFYVNTFLPPFA